METYVFVGNLDTYVLFKSHYVVWKLLEMLISYMNNYMFKSHYVVWKRRRKKIAQHKYFGLNRTM